MPRTKGSHRPVQARNPRLGLVTVAGKDSKEMPIGTTQEVFGNKPGWRIKNNEIRCWLSKKRRVKVTERNVP